MSENLDEIVTGLLLSLNESPNHNVLKRYGQFLPPPTITNFNSQSIIKSLEYIKTCISGEGSAIEIVAAKDCGIPNILFGMRKRLSKEERKEERFRLILVYHLFLDKALDYFKTSLQHIAPFIVRETTQAMLNELRHIRICKPLKEVEQCIAKSCIMALKTLCSNSTSIEILSNSAADLVPDMIDSVLRLLVDDNVHPEIADLLHLLIIEKGPCLKKTLSIVDELPNEPFLSIVKEKHKKFRTEEETLDEVMQTFLKGCCCRKNSIRQEGLLTLLHEIRKRKHELKGIALFTENGSLLSEHLEESVIHLTICHLLMFSHSSSLEIQQIAAQCLGEIGTINLGSPILPSVGVAKKYAAFSSNDELDIYEALINYLSDERVKVFQAASSVLRNLLSTSDGKRFVSKCLKNGQLKLYQYCFPLMSRSNSAIGTGANDLDSFSDIVNNSELWSPETQTSYDSWISGIVCSILSTGSHKSSLYQELKPLCLVEPNFCEQILPYVISAILKQKNERHKDILSHQISGFISKHCLLKEKNIKHPDSESSILTPENGNSSLFLCKNAIRAILSIIHHLRMRKKEKDLNIWQTEFSLNINYLQMASAAAYCGAYFTTLLYLELWCDEMNRVMKANEDPDFDSQGSSQFMRLQSHDQIETVQTLLLESFKGIGDIDAIQGCSRIIGDSFPLRISLYEQENKWDRVLSVYDAETTQKHSSQSLGVLRALQKRGLTNTFQGYLHGLMINLDEPSTELVEFQSECAWRTNQWNFVVPEMTSTGVHQSLFKALCHLQNKEYEASMKELKIGRQNVLSGIPVIGASFESVKSVYPFLSQLQALSTVETAVRHQSGSFPLDLLLNEWQSTNNVPFSSFDLIEPTLCLQSVIFRQIINRDHRRGGLLLKGLVRTLEKIIKTAREDNHLEIAENALRQLKKEYQDSNENIWHLKLEEARIYWCRGEANVAKQLLKSMLKPLEQQMEENERGQMKFLYAECLMQYGKWQAETSGESTSTILSNYLEKALTLLKSSSNKELRYEGHLAIARYSDTQYQSLKKYRNTTAFQIKVNTISQARDEAQRLREVKDKNTDHVKAMKIMERQCNIDESEITKLDESIKNFRVKALENYLLCLRDTKAHDLRVFRVISIWFENNKDEDINEILKSQVEKLPTYKFLPLIYQLAARMGTQDVGDFNRILIELIKRMCRDHPYHTVPVLLALCNANKDDTSSQPQTSKSKKKVSVTSHIPEKRTAAAHEVIDHMTKFLPTYISQIKKLCEDYIALAYFPTTDLKSFSSYKIPISLSLHRSNYDRVPILTQELQIDCSCKYEKLVCIKNFSSEYYLCTGINAPKRVDCYSSDGKRHLQLLKSQDDLRQDAVMQQVFALVNCFLNKNVESKKSKLHIRTYKVIPLSKRSGVLQWCDGTQPVGLYLVGQNNKSGAHKRYYPKEWDALKCRQHLSKQTTDCSKLELYQQICENFSPVFRYFFLENFPEPAKWYERRLAYSRSVAVNSIVGYILGLGDRHVQNILVDNCTAELILIDFGIAFEQGKILPTPETVPFRLTREIVDGFGICGVEGVFRRSCEKTMEVMRGSQESLLTILEVLLYDPLYMWSISADKAATIQKKTTKEHHVRHENGNDSDHNGKEINKLAERVLLNLQQKLQGVEDNVALSVSGQVGCLIQQAKDPQNLCRIFSGWQPYL